MKTKKNEPTQPNDARRAGERNRIDNTQPGGETTPRSAGSTDDMNAMQPPTTGSNEMAGGNPAESNDRNTGRSMGTNPNSEDMIGENAGGNFPINEETPGKQNEPDQRDNDTEAVKKSS